MSDVLKTLQVKMPYQKDARLVQNETDGHNGDFYLQMKQGIKYLRIGKFIVK